MSLAAENGFPSPFLSPACEADFFSILRRKRDNCEGSRCSATIPLRQKTGLVGEEKEKKEKGASERRVGGIWGCRGGKLGM